MTTGLARLQSGKVQSAKAQELAMVTKATQIAGLGENGEGVGRPDARHGHKSPAIGIILQQKRSLFGDPLAQPMQAQILFEHQAEHCYRGTIERHWHADRLFGAA
jgi:hypothetical protein